MIKSKINELLKLETGNEAIKKLMTSPEIKKRYSITKNEQPYHIGDNVYQAPFCLFFYKQGYVMKSYLCYIVCTGANFSDLRIKFDDYPCSDVGRADCWEWVNIN